MKLTRIGDSLGLGMTPSVYFRYNRNATGAEAWEVFNPIDQLKLMAKFVFVYKHRRANAANTFLLDRHLVGMECTHESPINVGDDGQETALFDVCLFLEFADPKLQFAHGNTFRKSRVMQIVVAPGQVNPFADCKGIITSME